MCYYYDVSQSCSAPAIQGALSLPSEPDLGVWTPTPTECLALLDATLFFAKEVATTVFGDSILSANTASVDNYEILTYTWALQAGHIELKTDAAYLAFVNAVNNITDWATVLCDELGNLSYDGKLVPLPDFVESFDCGVLGSLYSFDCTQLCPDNISGGYCCRLDVMSSCCESKKTNQCSDPSCYLGYRDPCCGMDSLSPCCTGN